MNFKNKTKTIILVAILIVAISATTSWATTNLSNQQQTSTHTERQISNNNSQRAKAQFANMTSAAETDFTRAADMSIHAVVHIKTKAPVQSSQQNFFGDPFFDFFFGPNQRQSPTPNPDNQEVQPLASGSGVIINKDGYIVTNNHVIEKATEIEVTLNDKRTLKAKLIGTDPSTDIALLKIEDGKEAFPYISFGNSDQVKVGEWVLAVGNPFNLTSTVTAGIVSAKARTIGIIGTDKYGRKSDKLSIESFIQTDAAINAGNSGGALVNTNGELIGINTAIYSKTGAYAGYGFAVPSNIVQKVVRDIKEHGVVQRALLNIKTSDITAEIAKEKGIKTLDGALVAEVIADGAADKAGLKAYDVINEVNGTIIKSSTELLEQMSQYSPGDNITIGYLRNNKQYQTNAKLTNIEGSTSIIETNKFTKDLGVQLKPINNTVKAAIGLKGGLEVTNLTTGKFSNAGIKRGFIILKINNVQMNTIKDFEKIYQQSLKNKKSLNILGIYPTNGNSVYYEVK